MTQKSNNMHRNFLCKWDLFLCIKTEKNKIYLSMKLKVVIKCIEKDSYKYKEHKFSEKDIHANNKFGSKKIEDASEAIFMHMYAKGKHISFIENMVKTKKEIVPYKKHTRLMMQCLVEAAV